VAKLIVSAVGKEGESQGQRKKIAWVRPLGDESCEISKNIDQALSLLEAQKGGSNARPLDQKGKTEPKRKDTKTPMYYSEKARGD